MTKQQKSYDCVQAKREAQARIYEEIRDRSMSEQVDFFRREAASGELGAWWKRLRATKRAGSSSERA